MRLVALLAVLGLLPAAARADYAELKRFTLDNGLEVGLQPDPDRDFAAACVVYRVGAGDDPEGHRGLAHLTEHLMFAGTPAHPSGFFSVMEPVGATYINATTSFDRTTYCTEVPKGALELLLHTEADRMAYLLEHIEASHVATQRQVVLNEYAERGGGAAGSAIQRAEADRLFPGDHPYRRIYEDPEDIESLTLDEVRWFFQSYYGPSNAALVVAGGFDAAQAEAWIRRSFGAVRGRLPPERAPATIAPLTSRRSVVVDAPLPHERLRLSWVTPAWFEPGDAELDFIAWHLFEAIEERLDVEELLRLGARQQSQREGSVFRITLIGQREVDVVPFLEVVDEVLTRLRAGPLARDEFARIRDRYVASERRSEYRPLDRARSLAWSAGGRRMISPEENLERYRAVTAESVWRTAQEHLDPDRRLIVHGNFFGYAPREGAITLRSVR